MLWAGGLCGADVPARALPGAAEAAGTCKYWLIRLIVGLWHASMQMAAGCWGFCVWHTLPLSCCLALHRRPAVD